MTALALGAAVLFGAGRAAAQQPAAAAPSRQAGSQEASARAAADAAAPVQLALAAPSTPDPKQMASAPPAAANDSAAPADAAPTVTLDQAVSLALKATPTMAQAQGSTRNAAAAERTALGSYLPSLSVSGGTSLSSSDRFNSATNTIVNSGASTAYTAGINASVDLFTGGRRGAEMDAAKARSSAADASLVANRYSVTLAAEGAFYDVLRAQELADAAKLELQRAQEGQTAAEQRLKVGSATRSDVLRAQLAVTQARQALSQAQSQVRTNEYALGRLVGSSGPVAATSPASLEPKPLALTDEQLGSLVESQAPTVAAAQAELRAGNAGVKAAKSQYLPSLRLTGGYDWLTPQVSSFDQLRGSWQVGIGLSLPVFDGFQREQDVEAANVQADVAEAQLADAQRAVRADLEKSLAALENAQQQITLSQQAVSVAQEDLRVQQERYRLGASTILDVTTSQANLAQAETDLVNARYDYQIARAQLEALAGRSL